MSGSKLDSVISNLLLAFGQILLWGCSFFLLPVLAKPVLLETGWSSHWVYGCLSLSLLISGLLLPLVGRIINRANNGSVLHYAGFIMGAGLLLMAFSQHFALFMLSWVVIGIAMGLGLYDALFAVLGMSLGKDASKSIIQITLVSGFAPTISWPLLSALTTGLGWRYTCILCAVVLIIFVYPLHRIALKKIDGFRMLKVAQDQINRSTAVTFSSKMFYFLLIIFTNGALIMTGVSVYLMDLLLEHGLMIGVVVGIAALLGPSQVGVRVLDLVLPEKSPIVTGLVSSVLILAGLLILTSQASLALIGVIVFGMGNGMRSILRGTLPMALFGHANYPVIMGKLASVPLFAQAITPFLGGWGIELFGAGRFFLVLAVLAFINIILMIILYKIKKHEQTIIRFPG